MLQSCDLELNYVLKGYFVVACSVIGLLREYSCLQVDQIRCLADMLLNAYYLVVMTFMNTKVHNQYMTQECDSVQLVRVSTTVHLFSLSICVFHYICMFYYFFLGITDFRLGSNLANFKSLFKSLRTEFFIK